MSKNKTLNLENMTPQEKEIYNLALADFQEQQKKDGGDGKKGGGGDSKVEERLALLEKENQALKGTLGEWSEFRDWYKGSVEPHITGEKWVKFQEFAKGKSAGDDGNNGDENNGGGEGRGKKTGEYLTDEEILTQIKGLKKEFTDTLTQKEIQFLTLRNFDQQLFQLIRQHPELTDKEIEDLSKHMQKTGQGKLTDAYRDLHGEKEVEKRIATKVEEEKKKWEEDNTKKQINDMNMGFTVPKKAFEAQGGDKENKSNKVRQTVSEKMAEKYGPGVLR